MSFEMKYDRDGNPIKQNMPEVEQPLVEMQTQNESEMVETQTTEEPQEQPKPSVIAESIEEKNWRSLRAKAEQAERERDEAIRILKEIEARNLQKQEAPVEEEDSFSLEDDALAEGKHLKKVNQYVKNLEKQLKQYQQQSSLTATEIRLKAQYPDFDSVVSVDNLANLRAAYPEIAETINSSSDLYNKAVSAYTMIKKLGIAPTQDVLEQKALAKQNSLKPKPLASIAPQQGDTPLSRANAFASGKIDEDLKKQLWKEMNEARR